MDDDIEAIHQLKARYFRTMDTKDWDGLAAVFTEDVVIDMTGEGPVSPTAWPSTCRSSATTSSPSSLSTMGTCPRSS
jgi:ketosteroid isomerase-like protein